MKVRRLKINRIIIVVIALVIIIGGLIGIINNFKYRKSYDYKLEQKGYNESEVSKLKNTFEGAELDKVLELEYNKAFVSFINKKYFILNNAELYLNYYGENKTLSYEEVIAMVNTESSKDWYEDVKNTNVDKKELMLVNRYNGLTEDYEPDDLTLISNRYAYDGNYISESIYDQLVEMIVAASSEGYTLVVSQGYRSYIDQKDAYDSYRDYHNEKETDIYAARPGHSEYQTGLSFLIGPYNKVVEDVTISPENEWLLKNAHNYGFILRYPEDKESITGFSYDPWRFRYVGVEAASYIYENDITFDEYYAYYES